MSGPLLIKPTLKPFVSLDLDLTGYGSAGPPGCQVCTGMEEIKVSVGPANPPYEMWPKRCGGPAAAMLRIRFTRPISPDIYISFDIVLCETCLIKMAATLEGGPAQKVVPDGSRNTLTIGPGRDCTIG